MAARGVRYSGRGAQRALAAQAQKNSPTPGGKTLGSATCSARVQLGADLLLLISNNSVVGLFRQSLVNGDHEVGVGA